MSESKSLLSSGYGRSSSAILIHCRNGAMHFLPLQEIVWASATPADGSSIVEIETRSRVVRLAFGRDDAAGLFTTRLFKGEVSHVHEGTAPLLEASGYSESERGKADKPLTLVVQILDREERNDGDNQGGAPPLFGDSSPPPPARPGLGFPSY